MMDKEFFTNQVSEKFSFLIKKYGFHVNEESFKTGIYNNARIALESKVFNISITNERGQVLAYVQSTLNDDWIDLSDVINFINRDSNEIWEYDFLNDCINMDEKIKKQLSTISKFLESHYIQLHNFFTNPNYVTLTEELEVFQDELFQKRWNS